jgi:SAM-dependent methyltransferase
MSVFDYPRAYEVAFSYRDVAGEVDALLRWHGGIVNSALELAAGPADHALELAGRGCRTSTVDLNPAMSARAAERATERGLALAGVHTAHMTEFDLGARFDLVFCLIDSLAHVLDLDRLIAHLVCVRRHLAPGGAYVLETLHPADGFRPGSRSDTDWTVERPDVSARVRWGRGEPIDPLTQVTQERVTIDVRAPWGEQRVEEVLAQRFWTRDEVRAAARIAGLTVAEQYGDFAGAALDAPQAWRMISVLRAEPRAESPAEPPAEPPGV